MTTPSADATVLALDLGGTQIRAAVVRADGSRIGRAASATPVSSGPAAIVAVMHQHAAAGTRCGRRRRRSSSRTPGWRWDQFAGPN